MLHCETYLLQEQGLPSVAGVDFSALAVRSGLTAQAELARVVDDSGDWFIGELGSSSVTVAVRWYFDRTAALSDYNDLTMPPDAISAVAKAVELKVCHRVEIWWREGEAVAVGIWGTEAQMRRGTAKVYCIAHWGEQLRLFPDIVALYNKSWPSRWFQRLLSGSTDADATESKLTKNTVDKPAKPRSSETSSSSKAGADDGFVFVLVVAVIVVVIGCFGVSRSLDDVGSGPPPSNSSVINHGKTSGSSGSSTNRRSSSSKSGVSSGSRRR